MIVNRKVPYCDMVFLERQSREVVIRWLMTRILKEKGLM